MWTQKEIQLSPKKRGYHLVTDEILRQLPELSQVVGWPPSNGADN